MIIKQILNNNVVISTRDDKEIIVVGKGIGFNGRVNEEIDENKVEKTFVLQSENNIDDAMKNLLEAIPYEIVKFGIKATDYIIRCSNKKISDRILIPLIDHIYSCMQRYEHGFVYVNRDEHDLKDLARRKKKSFYWYKDVIANNGKDL